MAHAQGTDRREERSVRLEVPATAGYVVLARLALSAISRMTPLAPEDVADLKLAITEAATACIGVSEHDQPSEEPRSGIDPETTLTFSFQLDHDELLVDVGCEGGGALREDDDDLARAIIDATVDRWESRPEGFRLVKQLRR